MAGMKQVQTMKLNSQATRIRKHLAQGDRASRDIALMSYKIEGYRLKGT